MRALQCSDLAASGGGPHDETRKKRVSIQSSFPAADEVAQATADILAAIGERIRSARLAQGMTLQSLAVAANLST